MTVGEPPVQYVRDFPGELVVYEAAPADVDATCRELGSTYPRRILGCSLLHGGTLCFVVVPRPDDVPPATWAALRRHEIAHCNGWTHK